MVKDIWYIRSLNILVSIYPKLWVISMCLSIGMSTPPRNLKGRCSWGKVDGEK